MTTLTPKGTEEILKGILENAVMILPLNILRCILIILQVGTLSTNNVNNTSKPNNGILFLHLE